MISTNNIRLGRREGTFVYLASGKKTPVGIEIVEKIKPVQYVVGGKAVKGKGKLSGHSATESEIEERPAVQLSNFKKAVESSGVFGGPYINRFIVAILITVGQVFTSSLGAYAFARPRFPFRNTLFLEGIQVGAVK